MDPLIPATPPSPPMTASTALIHRIDQLLVTRVKEPEPAPDGDAEQA
mgnify:CR=1 FL=1